MPRHKFSPIRLFRLPVYFYCRRIRAKEALTRDALRTLGRDPDQVLSEDQLREILHLACSYGRFRTVALYRAETQWERLAARLLRLVNPGLPTTEIFDTPLGAGFCIHHGQAVVIRAARIGKDCDVFQQVTVGVGRGGYPTIGDRVDICAGALVIGAISVGDDAIIGAGAVVTNDVPAGAVVAGNPARQIGEAPDRRVWPTEGADRG